MKEYKITLKGRETLVTTVRVKADDIKSALDEAVRQGKRLRRNQWNERWVTDIGVLEVDVLTPEATPPVPDSQLALPGPDTDTKEE